MICLSSGVSKEDFISMPFDRPISHLAAEIRRGSKIKLPDAAIAASALYYDVPLVTRNAKDFKKLKDLRLVIP